MTHLEAMKVGLRGLTATIKLLKDYQEKTAGCGIVTDMILNYCRVSITQLQKSHKNQGN